MYTYQSAVLRKNGKNQVFESVNIAEVPVSSLLKDYRDGYIVVTNPLLTGQRFVSLTKLRESDLPFTTAPFTTWLASIGNSVLPELDEDPVVETKHVNYANYFQAGYNTIRVHPTSAPSSIEPESSKTDLLIQRVGMDVLDFFKHALITVGGFIYRTDNTAHGIRVKDAGRVSEVGGASTAMGIISFKNVCEISQHSITSPMLAHNTVNAPYSQEVIVNTGIDAEGKGVMLVLGGYLHLNDSTFDVISYNPLVIKINTNKIPLLERYFEARKFMPMDHLSLTVDEDKPGTVSVPEFFSDVNIEAQLTSIHSFVVLTDEPILYYKKHVMNHSCLPGLFETNIVPKWPVRTTYGRLPETWVRKAPGVWPGESRYLMTCAPLDNTQPNYLLNTYYWKTEAIVDDSVRLPKAFPYANAHLFEFGAIDANFIPDYVPPLVT